MAVIKSKKPKTRVIDHGFNAIVKELRKLEKKPYVKIGYPEKKASTNAEKETSDDSESFVTVLDVALWHEFGTNNMPERSFVRASFDQNQKKYEKLNRELLVKIYSGKMTVEKALDILGFTIENDIKAFIRSGEVNPESQRAINEGGTTLDDTGQLINSITFIKVMNP
jgi:hypothetical protein